MVCDRYIRNWYILLYMPFSGKPFLMPPKAFSPLSEAAPVPENDMKKST